MPPELDVRRVLRRAAFLAERVFLPADAHVRIGAVLEQRFRQLERGHVARDRRRRMSGVADAGRAVRARASQPGERVQRRAARIGRVRIGAAIEQQRRELEIRVDDGHVQRAGAVGRSVVHIGAVVEQHLDGAGVAVADGEQQRRESALRLRFHVGAVRDEHVRRGGVAFGRGPHQRGLPFVRFDGVHVRAGFEQQLHRVRPCR